jgi:ATP-dependent DNA ligase
LFIDAPSLKPILPMEAKPTGDLPAQAGWLYEPKYDGFRCIALEDALAARQSPARMYV